MQQTTGAKSRYREMEIPNEDPVCWFNGNPGNKAGVRWTGLLSDRLLKNRLLSGLHTTSLSTFDVYQARAQLPIFNPKKT
ncbi:MAG: hypothetical protein ACRER2_18935 [Methylococcales bacterium]